MEDFNVDSAVRIQLSYTVKDDDVRERLAPLVAEKVRIHAPEVRGMSQTGVQSMLCDVIGQVRLDVQFIHDIPNAVTKIDLAIRAKVSELIMQNRRKNAGELPMRGTYHRSSNGTIHRTR